MTTLKSAKTKVAQVVDISGWLDEIHNKRLAVGSNALDFKYAKCRVRQLKGPNYFPLLDDKFEQTAQNSMTKSGNPLSVVYWMIRDQRVQDNWAFLYAQRLALKFSVPLHVCFCLAPRFQADTLRHLTFMVEGLKEVEQECRALDIPFHAVSARSKKTTGKRTWSETDDKAHSGDFYAREVAEAVLQVIQTIPAGCIVTDFCPLREPTAWVKKLVELMPSEIPLCQVDAHNVVPVWIASDKLEYAARTIRPKLYRKDDLLTEFPPVIKHPGSNKFISKFPPIDWDAIISNFSGNCDVKPVDWAKGGTKHGFRTLWTFLNKRLRDYENGRNDPTKEAVSDLSPWFHFGHVAPQRALLEAKAHRSKHTKSVDAFIEETFVRRELSDNFCYYNPQYDSIKGAHRWAQETLTIHSKDPRKPAYTDEQMEGALTSDDLWNAAQRQLVRNGKMHGFLRMYWAKKILEWHTDGPEAALKLGFKLNDLYSLDGTDPNGFVGVMWSICGVHDQGWAERPVFGKIRCMTYSGCCRKFSVPGFVAMYPKQNPCSKPNVKS